MTNTSSIFLSYEWWISVVIVGLMINLISAYAKPKIDDQVAKLSHWWANQNEKERLQRTRRIESIRSSPQIQHVLGVQSIRRIVTGSAYALASLLFAIIRALIPFPIEESPSFLSQLRLYFPLLMMAILIGMAISDIQTSLRLHAELSDAAQVNNKEIDKVH
jgi:flagellar biosynthesis protein FliQ